MALLKNQEFRLKMKITKLKNFIIQKLTDELSEKLTYHGVKHTLMVFNVCNQFIKRMKIAPHDAHLIRTAALMHDTGFIHAYDNHEEQSVIFARKILPHWNYSERDIEIVSGMIRATKIPQNPKNMLEGILADADLDYLGTTSFYEIADTLRTELYHYNKISSDIEWITLQIDFLKRHNYYTAFSKKYREPTKQKYLKEIKEKWGR